MNTVPALQGLKYNHNTFTNIMFIINQEDEEDEDIDDDEAELADLDVDIDIDLDNPVTDMSILPALIRPYCANKPIYWLKLGSISKYSHRRLSYYR